MYTVAKILEIAVITLQKTDYLDYLKNGTVYPRLDEDNEKLMACYNVVITELCEEYLPLVKTETIIASDNKFYFEDFSETPVEIRACYDNGTKIDYIQTALYIECQANQLTVEYVYCPAALNFNYCCPYSGTKISARIISLGVIREFLLINGLYEEAVIYDERYRKSIAAVLFPRKIKTMKAGSLF